MKKLLFKHGGIIREMNINKIKIIKGNDYHTKYLLYQTIRSNIFGKKSEYLQEFCNQEILIDNNICRYKSDQFFDVNPFFNFEDDFKLGTKSLSYRYLISILSTDIYFDSINTANILLQALKDEFNETDSIYKVDINEFNNQLLIKMLKPFFLMNDFEANMYDLNYDDIVLQQLKLIEVIIENTQKEFILVLNLHKLSNSILQKLNRLQRTLIIVFTVETEMVEDLNMMYLVANGGIDFCDIGSLYFNICERSGNLWTEEELIMNLKNYFNGIDCEQSRLIDQQLKK